MGIFKDLPGPIIYFSNCYGTPIYDENKHFQGKLADLFIDYTESYPTVLAILIKKNKKFGYIKWDNVHSFSYKKIIIALNAKVWPGKKFTKSVASSAQGLLKRAYQERSAQLPGVSRAILDRQIVDTSGKKVVRVNDIHFIKIGRALRATHAAIGAKSMLRRLGLEGPMAFLLRAIYLNPKKELKEKIISWKFVHAIADKNLGDVKLSVTNEDLSRLHPADLADIIEGLDDHRRRQIFKELDEAKAADTLAEIAEENLQTGLLKAKTPEEAAKIIEHMGTDEAADVLGEMSQESVQNIIAKIKGPETRAKIQELLSYAENTAGGLMSTDIFTVSPGQHKNDIITLLEDHHQRYENIYDIYIISEEKTLLGTCSLRKLLTNKENIKIGDIMNSEDMKYQTFDIHWKELATFMSKYNLINIPIVDKKKKVLGFVSVDDILPWLLNEH